MLPCGVVRQYQIVPPVVTENSIRRVSDVTVAARDDSVARLERRHAARTVEPGRSGDQKMTGAQPPGGSAGTRRLLIVRALRGAAFVAVVQATEVGNRGASLPSAKCVRDFR
jgi:hypothetical protein